MCSTATTRRDCYLRLLFAIAIVPLLLSRAVGQNAVDATTPPGQSPGAPAGSYALSGFDNVNLFNGHLNFRLPLLTVNGRGGGSFASALPIEQRWTVDHDQFGPYHFPNYNWWTGLRPGYGPGVLQGRQMSEGCPEDPGLTQGTTRLTFTASDGTEYELRDQIYGGQAASSNCNPWDPQAPGTSRGTIFVTADGSSATFVSDSTIYDHTYTPSGPRIITPSGYLMLRDGTRFRIDGGLVTWMRDRNGNKISFTYQGSWLSWRITSATDSLNRQITYQYNFSDPTYGVCDRIIFKGFGGAQRIIRIVRTPLSNALISGESLATYQSLFPTLNGSSSTYHNPEVVSVVWLPDGVRSYQFRYNRYGELCRVDLPTGGRFEYSWTQFSQGMGFQPEINRRVTERRTYSESGALASRSTYGGYESDAFGTQGSVQADHLDFAGGLVSREKHYFHGHPFSYTIAGQFDLPNPTEGREFKTEFINTNGTTVLRRIDTTWTTCGTLTGTNINPCVSQTVTTLEPATTNLVTKQTFSYDTYVNQTDVYEYAFGTGAAGSLVRRTHTEYLTTNPVNGTNYATTSTIHLRSLPKLMQVIDAAGVQRARTEYEYDNYATDSNHASLVNRLNISGLDSSFTTTYLTRGNSTAVTQFFINTSGTATGSISSFLQYDIAGNVVKAIDPRGNPTLYDFSDRFGTPDGNAQANSGATELGSQVSYAFAAKVTNALAHTTYAQFDYYSGKPVDIEDQNAVVSSLYYNDSLDRVTQVRRAVGTSVSNQTTFGYDDVNRIITTTSDLNSLGDNGITNKTLYDGLGRTTETRQYEGGSNYIVTQTQYDALNRPFKTSNPFRPWQSQTAVWTTQAFDALGRVISVTAPDNAVVGTSYSGNNVTVTDPAGKARRSVTDALGRLLEVYEDPNGLNYQTIYSYDVLDNLVKVTQGSQQRFFMYDSLKRLIRARNPEQGTNASLALSDPISGNSAWSIGYQYDASGNLTQKTDARGVVSTNAYDVLNRVTTTLYRINGQPDPNTGDVEYLYDNAAYGKGRLWLTYKWGTKPSHTAVGLYDPLGRITQFYNLFGDGQGGWSPGYAINRAYNLAGNVTSQTYPSGHTVTYSYDTAGRTTSFAGNLGDGVTRSYASSFVYNPRNQVTQELFGTQTPLYHKLQYNIRGQLWDVRVSTGADINGSWNRGCLQFFYDGSYGYGTSGPDNNGNVLKANTYVPLDEQINGWAIHRQNYSYDSLNRLSSVAEYFVSNSQGESQQSLQSYSYDRWGNRTINAAQTWGTGINAKQFTVDAGTNRLGVPSGQSGVMSYDNAGNLTTDTYTGVGGRTYDAENRMTAAADNTGQTSRYTYNAAGQRVRRQVASSQEEWEIYGIDGELVAEYRAAASLSAPEKEYGYRNGQLLVTATVASGVQNVNWTNAVGVSISGNNLTKTASTDWYNAHASSTQAINSGDGYVEFTASETTTNRMLGLGEFGSGYFTYSNIRYAIYLAGSVLYTSEYGALTNVGSYTTGDKLRVAIESGAVKYYKNGTLLRTSTVAPTYPLYANVALYQNGSTLTGAVINNGSSGAGSSAQIRWLVTDHLGTPRMIFDLSGTLANVKRHDYLPFGEELFAGTGGRTAAMGYAGGDGVRQQFTQKERDIETGLDFFLARYYSSTQGRFLSADPYSPILTKQVAPDPQSAQRTFTEWIGEPLRWNGYHYALNNPLRTLDPDGKNPQEALEALKQGLQRLDTFTNLAKSLISSGKANIIAHATQTALETLFGNVHFATGGLNASEIEFAKEVSAFEKRSFQGAGKSAQGIDGFLHDGKVPTNNPRPIQLQQNSTGGDYRLLDDAGHHERQASSAGYKNMVLYIKATDSNVTVNSVMQFIDNGGTGGFVGMTRRGTFTNVTIFAQDGVVRIDNGQVTAIWR